MQPLGRIVELGVGRVAEAEDGVAHASKRAGWQVSAQEELPEPTHAVWHFALARRGAHKDDHWPLVWQRGHVIILHGAHPWLKEAIGGLVCQLVRHRLRTARLRPDDNCESAVRHVARRSVVTR